MHLHRDHLETCDTCHDWPSYAHELTTRLDHLERMMTAFLEAQPAIDAVTAQLATVQTQVQALQAENTQLKADLAAQTINLQPLQDGANALVNDFPAAPADGDTAPTDAPVDQPTA